MSIEDKKEKKEVEFRAPSPPQGAGKPGVGQGRDGQHTLTELPSSVQSSNFKRPNLKLFSESYDQGGESANFKSGLVKAVKESEINGCRTEAMCVYAVASSSELEQLKLLHIVSVTPTKVLLPPGGCYIPA